MKTLDQTENISSLSRISSFPISMEWFLLRKKENEENEKKGGAFHAQREKCLRFLLFVPTPSLTTPPFYYFFTTKGNTYISPNNLIIYTLSPTIYEYLSKTMRQ